MKYFFFFLFLLLACNDIIGQAVSFNYDASGNRVSRKTIILKSTNPEYADNFKNEEPVNEQIGAYDLTIYPNPVKNQLTISITNSTEIINTSVSVFDQGGHLIVKENHTEDIFSLDMSNFSSGIYFMNIEIGHKISKWKIIKE
jgi:YD repeat-containing protein